MLLLNVTDPTHDISPWYVVVPHTSKLLMIVSEPVTVRVAA